MICAAGRACLVIVAVLAASSSATAAPIPGAHYTGTTDQNYPIAFDVAADGASLTNVVTTVNGFCTGGPGGLLPYSTDSVFAFPIAGDTISGDDPDKFPYLRMRGSFTSPQQASGNLSAFNGFVGYQCNALEREWTASTTASVPGGGNPGGGDPGGGNPGGGDPGGGDPGGGNPGGGNPGGALGKPAITIAFPKGMKLQPSLTNGFVVAAAVDQASTLSGKLILSAKDAKKYGLGKKARTIASDKVSNAGADALLEFKVSKSVAKKLKGLKKLSLLLDVTATRTDGVKGTGSKTLKFG